MERNERLKKAAESLNGITLTEWNKVKIIVDEHFKDKTREFERGLKLSYDDVQDSNLRQFG